MSKPHYYARSCRYGLGVAVVDMRGRVDSLPGVIARFGTRAARDAWVAADPRQDGRATREAVTRQQIAHKIAANARYFGGAATWYDPDNTGVEQLD